MATKPDSKPPLQFGQPEKPNWLRLITLWILIVLGIGGIVWMIKANPRQKALDCHTPPGAATSFSSFGTCTEE